MQAPPVDRSVRRVLVTAPGQRYTASMSLDVHYLLHLAKEAAGIAGAVHHGARREQLDVRTKGTLSNLVTEIDHEAERQLVEYIRRHRPADGIFGEEDARVAGSSGVQWVIDPLDGTTNFVHG